MHYKTRTEPVELLILSSLNKRKDMTELDKKHYLNLKKGYDGEVMFDTNTRNFRCECLILNDLLFKLNSTLFQIDTLIITSESIYIYEIKNFEGDFYYEKDKLIMKPNFEVINPIDQLSRCESLLRQLLQKLGFHFSIEASVVFINPEFTLYQSPLNKPFIFFTQLNRYLRNFNSIPSKLNAQHKRLADQLMSLHIKDAPYKQIPPFCYEELRKGITCKKCNSYSLLVKKYKCICCDCGHVEDKEASVLRSIDELKLLFPETKITTNIIHDWCKVIESKWSIQKILDKNFKMIGVHQWAYYE